MKKAIAEPSPEVKARMADDINSDLPNRWWWLSFADENGNRGCCIVRGGNMAQAILQSHRFKINPGGGVQGVGFEFGMIPRPEYRNKLFRGEAAKKLAALKPEELFEENPNIN